MNKYEVDPEKAEENFHKQMEQLPLEPKDVLAMVIAGLLVAIPVLLLVGGMVLLCLWLVAGRG